LFNSNTSLIGGAGTDSITFDDHLDSAGKTYSFNPSRSRAARSRPRTARFEAQDTQDLQCRPLPGFVQSNTINLNSFSRPDRQHDDQRRDESIAARSIVTQGNLAGLGSALTVNLPGSLDNTLNLKRPELDRAPPAATLCIQLS
jgi:hypothetical protein